MRQQPSEFDNKVFVDRAVGEMNAEDPTEATQANVARIRELIAEIERRGGRALLIEIPFSIEIDGSRFVGVTWNIVHGAFPDLSRWLPIDAPGKELALGRRRASRRAVRPDRRARDRVRPGRTWQLAPLMVPRSAYTAAVVTPPSMTMVWPVMKLEASEAR